MKGYSFTIDNAEQTYPLKRGYSLLNNLLLNNIVTHSKCGGKAICGRCRIKITAGIEHCNKPLPEERGILNSEQIDQGWRLACQTQCIRDIRFYIPTQSEVEENPDKV